MAYTAVTLNEASEVVKLAGFDELLKIEKLDGGWANSNYKLILKNGKMYVLKIWNEQSEEEVNYLLNITSYLANRGIPTPIPIPFKNGNLVTMKKNLPWTILPFVEGEWLKSDYDSLFTLGKTQAKMHKITPPVNLKQDFSMGLKLFEKIITISDSTNKADDFTNLLKENLYLFHEYENLPRGIIHGDLFPDNVIGKENNELSLLDFEEVCEDVLVFDLAMTFVGFGWEQGEPIKKRWEAILDGYQSIRNLSPDEINALPDLHKLATLSIAAWRYWQFKINIPGSLNEDRYLEMTSRLSKELPF